MPLVESDLCANCQRCDGIILYHISVFLGTPGHILFLVIFTALTEQDRALLRVY